LVARPGLTGVTGNIYFGLHEFEDMSFTLHMLRPKDLFIDVGANCGSYTVLASGAVGATTVAFEPVPAAADLLDLNIRVNKMADCVTVRRCGVAAELGELPFTMDQDTTNHVAATGEAGEMIPIETLNYTLDRLAPTMIKIDVEGFEAEVLRGSQNFLTASGLKALIVEISHREDEVMNLL
jgi:FkbM family methyltransferase